MMHGSYSRSGQLVSGKLVSVLSFSNFRGHMLSLSFLVSVLSFSNQNPCVTNPMSILYISPMTDKKTRIIYIVYRYRVIYIESTLDFPVERTQEQRGGYGKSMPQHEAWPWPLLSDTGCQLKYSNSGTL